MKPYISTLFVLFLNQTSSVRSRIEQFEKNVEDKPIERPMQRGTSKHAPVTPYQAESHPLQCEQDDGKKRTVG